MKRILLVAFVLLLSILPAMAVEEHREEDTTAWDISADEDHVISGMDLNNLDPNHEITLLLYQDEDVYNLHLTCERYLGRYTFTLNMTYPNGTVTSKTLTTWKPLQDDVEYKIQYYYDYKTYGLDSSYYDDLLDIDVYVGLLPLNAQFTSLSSAESSVWGDVLPSDYLYTVMAFTRVGGTSSAPADICVYLSNATELQEQKDQNPYDAISYFLSWTWDKILIFISKIPGIGPYMVSTISILSILVDDGFWWFNLLFIENPETTLLTFEFFILSNAVLKTKRKSNVMALVDRIVSSHITLIEFFYNIFLGLINAVSTIISTIASIVQGLKPL